MRQSVSQILGACVALVKARRTLCSISPDSYDEPLYAASGCYLHLSALCFSCCFCCWLRTERAVVRKSAPTFSIKLSEKSEMRVASCFQSC